MFGEAKKTVDRGNGKLPNPHVLSHVVVGTDGELTFFPCSLVPPFIAVFKTI